MREDPQEQTSERNKKMPIIIKLTVTVTRDGKTKPLYVNASNIRCFYVPDASTVLEFTNGDTSTVIETPEQIVEMIAAKTNEVI